MATYTEQLAEIQTAITDVLSGQSYSLTSGDGTGISVTKANIQVLYAEERRLRREVARESRGGIRVIGGTPV